MLMNYSTSIDEIAQMAPKTIEVALVFLERKLESKHTEMKTFLVRLSDAMKREKCSTEILDFSFAGLQPSHRKTSFLLLV